MKNTQYIDIQRLEAITGLCWESNYNDDLARHLFDNAGDHTSPNSILKKVFLVNTASLKRWKKSNYCKRIVVAILAAWRSSNVVHRGGIGWRTLRAKTLVSRISYKHGEVLLQKIVVRHLLIHIAVVRRDARTWFLISTKSLFNLRQSWLSFLFIASLSLQGDTLALSVLSFVLRLYYRVLIRLQAPLQWSIPLWRTWAK